MITILIDWISATDLNPKYDKSSSHSALHDGNWSEAKGKNGYNLAQKHITGLVEYQNLKREDMGKHIVISGKTLQKIKDNYMLTEIDLLQYHISEGHSITRLDCAIDFKGYGLTVEEFVRAFESGNVTTKLRTATVIHSLTGAGDTLYIGSMKKRKNLVRVYDKAKELGVDGDWIRVELQIMGKKATTTGKLITRTENLESDILGIIKSVCDFKTVAVWDLLMNDQLQVKMQSEPKKLGDTEKWLIKQVIPALSRTIVLNVGFWAQFTMALQAELPDNYNHADGEVF